MKHFPVYLNLCGRRVVVAGCGETAVPKLRLLMKTEAEIAVFGENPHEDVLAWAGMNQLRHHLRPVARDDISGAALVYCASGLTAEDARVAGIADELGVPANIVDNLEDSAFITPAIVDRDPVTVAIGTEGAAPVLARKLKAQIEELLPSATGMLAHVGKSLRPMVRGIPPGRERRAFWTDFYSGTGLRAFVRDGEDGARRAFGRLLAGEHAPDPHQGRVSFVGAGPGDPELLTLRARNRLHEADVVIHDRLVPEAILDLARREALVINAGKKGFGPSCRQSDINELTARHAAAGNHVVRLKSGDPSIFGRLDEETEALKDAGIEFEVVPGLSAAFAAAASFGASLTRRGRNSEVSFVTGHDADGPAELDWKGLARPGAVAAVYMGRRAAKFIRGRLLMHGADGGTPVTVVENASLPRQKRIATTLIDLPTELDSLRTSGPVVLLIGLAPAETASDFAGVRQGRG